MMRIRPAARIARQLWTGACRSYAVYLVEVSLGIHYDIRGRLWPKYDDVPATIEEQTALGALRTALPNVLVHIPRDATRWMGERDPVPFFERPGEEEASSRSHSVTSLFPFMSMGGVGLLAAIFFCAAAGWCDPVNGVLLLSLTLGIAALWAMCRYANIGWLSLAYLEDREAQFPGYPSDASVYLASNFAQSKVKARDLARFAEAGMAFQRHLRAEKRQGWILVPPDSDEPDVRTLRAGGRLLRLAPKRAPARRGTRSMAVNDWSDKGRGR